MRLVVAAIVQIAALRLALETSQAEEGRLRRSLEEAQEELLCPVCEDNKVEVALIPCGHTACQPCVTRLTARISAAHNAAPLARPEPGPSSERELVGTLILGECHMCRRPYHATQRFFLGGGC